MSAAYDTINSLVSITQFNKGQASKIFDRLRSEKHLIVLKNNTPSAVILSPDEFMRLSEIEENYCLLIEAERRLDNNKGKSALSSDDVLSALGLTQKDIDNAEDLEIE